MRGPKCLRERCEREVQPAGSLHTCTRTVHYPPYLPRPLPRTHGHNHHRRPHTKAMAASSHMQWCWMPRKSCWGPCRHVPPEPSGVSMIAWPLRLEVARQLPLTFSGSHRLWLGTGNPSLVRFSGSRSLVAVGQVGQVDGEPVGLSQLDLVSWICSLLNYKLLS